MAQDSPNDQRYILVKMLRPLPIRLAVCQAIGGPKPTAIAVFFDRQDKTFSLIDVAV